MGTFRKYLFMLHSRRLGVMLFGLLSYRGDNDNTMEKYTYRNEESRGKLPLEIGSVFRLKLQICS